MHFLFWSTSCLVCNTHNILIYSTERVVLLIINNNTKYTQGERWNYRGVGEQGMITDHFSFFGLTRRNNATTGASNDTEMANAMR